MRTADADILIVPGLRNAVEDHWQSRWEAKLPTARRVDLGDWHQPTKDRWVDNLATAVASCTRPVVLVGHSYAGIVITAAAARLQRERPGLLAGLALSQLVGELERHHEVQRVQHVGQQAAHDVANQANTEAAEARWGQQVAAAANRAGVQGLGA